MKRRVIPHSTQDRILAALAFGNCALCIPAALQGEYIAFLLALLSGIMCGVQAYVLQDLPGNPDDDEGYTKVISQITTISKQLTSLNTFLKREQARVADTRATIEKLAAEKTKLEPLILTHRQTVEAILSAHADRTSKNIWKERVFGFGLGAVASLLASFIYEYIKR